MEDLTNSRGHIQEGRLGLRDYHVWLLKIWILELRHIRIQFLPLMLILSKTSHKFSRLGGGILGSGCIVEVLNSRADQPNEEPTGKCAAVWDLSGHWIQDLQRVFLSMSPPFCASCLPRTISFPTLYPTTRPFLPGGSQVWLQTMSQNYPPPPNMHL